MKRIILSFILFVFVFSLMPFSVWAADGDVPSGLIDSDPSIQVSDFADVPEGVWYQEELQLALDWGITKGTSPGMFQPELRISRGQFVTMLGRAVGEEMDPEGRFQDVDPDMYYAPYVYWAESIGVVKGTSDTTFAPDVEIQRQDVAVILARLIDAYGYSIPGMNDAVTPFADEAAISGYAYNACNMLHAAGIFKGDNMGNMNPRNSLSRAEAVALIVRVLQAADNSVDMWSGEDSRPGFVGYLRIPDVDIEVPCFSKAGTDKTNQDIADEINSAVIFTYGPHTVIGDHVHHTFSKLCQSAVGETVAYFNNNGEKLKYICVETGIGFQTEEGLFDENGVAIIDREPTDLFLYACHPSGGAGCIFYAFFSASN